jgi:hypothetical protein
MVMIPAAMSNLDEAPIRSEWNRRFLPADCFFVVAR